LAADFEHPKHGATTRCGPRLGDMRTTCGREMQWDAFARTWLLVRPWAKPEAPAQARRRSRLRIRRDVESRSADEGGRPGESPTSVHGSTPVLRADLSWRRAVVAPSQGAHPAKRVS